MKRFILFLSERGGGFSVPAKLISFRYRVCRRALFYPLKLNIHKSKTVRGNFYTKNMADTPRENEIKYEKFLKALKTLAPAKTFGGVTLTEFEAQTEKSDAPRNRIVVKNDEIKQDEVTRDSEDVVTMRMCEMIKNGVVADPEFGDDSALYEALGYVRKSMRKSGLTRKKTEPKKD